MATWYKPACDDSRLVTIFDNLRYAEYTKELNKRYEI